MSVEYWDTKEATVFMAFRRAYARQNYRITVKELEKLTDEFKRVYFRQLKGGGDFDRVFDSLLARIPSFVEYHLGLEVIDG